MNQGFPKAEHLCSRRLMERLHAEGHRLMVFPYKVQWVEEPKLKVPCQVLIVAPKRKLRHAVDRNRIKRLTRECYRLHKDILYRALRENDKRILLSLSYVHDELMTYSQLYHKFDKLMDIMAKELSHEETVQSTEMVAE